MTTIYANPFLSTEDSTASSFISAAKNTFASRPLVNRMQLAPIQATLDRVRTLCDARNEKVFALINLAENVAACGHLTGVGADLNSMMQQIEAETAMRDRLHMAANGLVRAIEWRQENPHPNDARKQVALSDEKEEV